MCGRFVYLPAALLAGVVLAGCDKASDPALTAGEDVRLEGRVIETDSTPRFVDGDGLIFLDSKEHGKVVVRIPARERICEAQGLGTFSMLEAGDDIRLLGRVTGERDVTVCGDASHFLEKRE